ncbi:hypothetical protein BG015_002971 [Linnemannia schmuckeri]|uniref:Uncharacterized protein n=1 Tax=Linnemannia schmuckeri TaxID=64567 RepID=A0A9P5S5F2_9FUNG|nr:hypothetical protein BG015_002971 [Linnemannia schmuckeri]
MRLDQEHAMKRKGRDYDEDQDSQHKKNRANHFATANTAITATTSGVLNRTASGHTSSISVNKTAATTSISAAKSAPVSFSSTIITRARARGHNAVLYYPPTPPNKLKHRLESTQEDTQEHAQDSLKRYKAQSKAQALSTSPPSPTPSLTPSTLFTLSQTSSRRRSSSSARLASKLPESSSSKPKVSTKPHQKRKALRQNREVVERNGENTQMGKTSGLNCLEKYTEFGDTSKEHMGESGRGPLVSTTMNQGQGAELTKSSKSGDSSQDGEAQKIDETETHNNILEVAKPNQYCRVEKAAEIHEIDELYSYRRTQEIAEVKAGQKRHSRKASGQQEDNVDNTSVGIRRSNDTRTERAHAATQDIEETEVDFELDIRGPQKRDNYPPRDRLPRVAGNSPPDRFRLRTLTRLVSSAKSTFGKSTENLHSYHARQVDGDVAEIQLDSNHPWAQGPVEFMTPRSKRHNYDVYGASGDHFSQNYHVQDYNDYNSQDLSSTAAYSRIHDGDIYSRHSPSYKAEPTTAPHMSRTDSLQTFTYSSANGGSVIESSSSSGTRHSHPSTMGRVGELNPALSFVHYPKQGRQPYHHRSNSNTITGGNYNNNYYSTSSSHLHHIQNRATKRYDTDENTPPPSYKAPTFNFPTKKHAEAVPLILSINERSAGVFSNSNSNNGSDNDNRNSNTGNQHTFDINVIEGSNSRSSRCLHASGHYLL